MCLGSFFLYTNHVYTMLALNLRPSLTLPLIELMDFLQLVARVHQEVQNCWHGQPLAVETPWPPVPGLRMHSSLWPDASARPLHCVRTQGHRAEAALVSSQCQTSHHPVQLLGSSGLGPALTKMLEFWPSCPEAPLQLTEGR